MKECWSEGALRAYLDRELPVEEMDRVTAHLDECSECGDLWAELSGRAARVSALMDVLSTPDRTVSISRAPRPARRIPWQWAGAAAALAAGLVLGFVAIPKRQPPATVALPAHTAVLPAAANPVEPDAPAMMNAIARPARARQTRPVKRQDPSEVRSSEDFVSLDDEPIGTGVVLRVELGPKGIPADVIFGSDGRPHAIRLVNNKSNH